MVQLVTKPPQKRFRTSKSSPGTPRLAQRCAQVGPFGLFGPISGLGWAQIGGQKSDSVGNTSRKLIAPTYVTEKSAPEVQYPQGSCRVFSFFLVGGVLGSSQFFDPYLPPPPATRFVFVRLAGARRRPTKKKKKTDGVR